MQQPIRILADSPSLVCLATRGLAGLPVSDWRRRSWPRPFPNGLSLRRGSSPNEEGRGLGDVTPAPSEATHPSIKTGERRVANGGLRGAGLHGLSQCEGAGKAFFSGGSLREAESEKKEAERENGRDPRRAFAQLRLVCQLRPYLGKSDLATVVHALVTSRLDYCNALYVGLPLKTARKLQLVQRAAARLLTGAAYREHTTPLLSQLHWLPICYRAQFKVLVLAYKALNGSGPIYLSERIFPYEPTRTLRSSGEALLSVPPASQARRVGTRDRAFSVVAPRLWNSLPSDIRQAPSLLGFRKKLKTWLCTQAFEE
ncbi:uncharacterized protein LOC134297289 [Anolis carolinensis]|uniref:uncharacterized protein LOC134297289 n=1 Tax=Anolis carolinensis TaxID=28377 RepID=UPI002F2B6A4F